MSRMVLVTVPEAEQRATMELILRLRWASSLEVAPARRILYGCVVEVLRIQFKVRARYLGSTLKALKSEGIGARVGTVDVLDVRVSTEALPHDRPAKRGCCRSLTDRLSTVEIHETIAASSHLDADHVTRVTVASLIGGVGLMTDSTAVIFAAFFISPLMTMLLGIVWGCCVGDWPLARRSLRNLLYDTVLCVSLGFFGGFVLCLVLPRDPGAVSAPITDNGRGTWTIISVSTQQILSRGPPLSNIVVSAVVAALSGIAVALGHSGGSTSALAGVALSTSLLPPLVNVGLMLAIAMFYPSVKTSRGDALVKVAGYSAMIYVANVAMVISFCFITLKVKRIGGRTLKAAKRDFAASSPDAVWRPHSSSIDSATPHDGDESTYRRKSDIVLETATDAPRHRRLNPDDIRSLPSSNNLLANATALDYDDDDDDDDDFDEEDEGAAPPDEEDGDHYRALLDHHTDAPGATDDVELPKTPTRTSW